MSILPLIPLRGLVLFPGAITPLMVGPAALAAVDHALATGEPLLFTAQRDPDQAVLGVADLHTVGCEGRVLRSARFSGEGGGPAARVLVEGLARVSLSQIQLDLDGAFYAEASPLHPRPGDPVRRDALASLLRTQLVRLLTEDPEHPDELLRAIPEEGPERLADYAVGALAPGLDVQQALLAEPSLVARLERLAAEAGRAAEALALKGRISDAVQKAMDEGQREYYLREQLKVIRKELGEPDGLDDVDRVQDRLAAVGLTEVAREEADRELERMRRMHSDTAEYNVARTWLDWLAALPWAEVTEDNHDLGRARAVLDADHYGLKRIKDRILEYIAVRTLKPDARGMILCFVGPPGVGKTSLGESIARALGRQYQRVALGGVRDEAEIRGHRRTYIGAMPGRVIQALRRAGSRNPLILLDELDKLSSDFRGDPASALLEVLDPEQNHSFTDHYLDVPFDLSQVLFVATANVAGAIPPALQDRMELIELPGYMEEEKLEIARRHLLPRVREAHGLTEAQITVPRSGLVALIRRYTREAGVRNLERELARVHRVTARKVVEGRKRPTRVSADRLRPILGPPRWQPELVDQAAMPGVAVGLAWTPVGGEILFIEAVRFAGGKGAMTLTGSLGDVMKESAQAALSLLRREGRFGGPEDYTTFDYHVHVPAGAIPKDGPSAGVAMLSALASLISGRPVRPRLAMTGEITLRGRVLPVGGVVEKVLAARRAGVREVLLPEHNAHDLEEVPAALLKSLKFHYLRDTHQALELALAAPDEP
jgi:ATP-dependent Lon protease